MASAWLDVDDLRLLAHLVTTRQFKDVLDRGRFEKFGGSDRDGAVESRTLVIEWDPGQDGKFARYPLPHDHRQRAGPAHAQRRGAAEGRADRQAVHAPARSRHDEDHAGGAAYIQAYEAAHHHRIIAEKVREVQEKLAGRAEPACRAAAARR